MPRDRSTTSRSAADAKLAEAILYVSQELAARNDPFRGAVKLNKVLWRADFESFRRHGEAVTWADYQRLPEGPAPVRLLPVRERLETTGDAHRETNDVGGHHSEQVLIADRPPDLRVLSERDVEALDEALDHYFGTSAGQTSEMSHDESVGWQALRDKDIIPYETALIDPDGPKPRSGMRNRVASLVKAHEASAESAT